jgi:hypothetical protein
VQAFPSSQAFVLFVYTHPVAGLQESVVQSFPSSQATGVRPTHAPPPHTSPVVQSFPSSQAFVLFVKTQPDARVQVSVVHGLRSLQMTPTPLHAPPLQVSPVVHSLPSSQAFVLLVNTHPVAELHVSVVQTLLSSQTTGRAPAQAPPPHASPVVQAFPSSHAFVLFVKTQPAAGVQVSVVHGLLSSQTMPVPVQVPPPHTSPVVQTFPSVHAVPSVTFGFEQTPVVALQTPATWH